MIIKLVQNRKYMLKFLFLIRKWVQNHGLIVVFLLDIIRVSMNRTFYYVNIFLIILYFDKYQIIKLVWSFTNFQCFSPFSLICSPDSQLTLCSSADSSQSQTQKKAIHWHLWVGCGCHSRVISILRMESECLAQAQGLCEDTDGVLSSKKKVREQISSRIDSLLFRSHGNMPLCWWLLALRNYSTEKKSTYKGTDCLIRRFLLKRHSSLMLPKLKWKDHAPPQFGYTGSNCLSGPCIYLYDGMPNSRPAWSFTQTKLHRRLGHSWELIGQTNSYL